MLETDSFLVSILRPPMVYGPNCPGNYQLLKKITLKLGVAPKMNSKKSFIFIDNLCNLLFALIQQPLCGIFCPQNQEIMETYEMMQLIGKYNNKRIILLPILSPLIKLASFISPKLSKAFGCEFYSPELSQINGLNYCVVPFDESIKMSEFGANDHIPT